MAIVPMVTTCCFSSVFRLDMRQELEACKLSVNVSEYQGSQANVSQELPPSMTISLVPDLIIRNDPRAIVASP